MLVFDVLQILGLHQSQLIVIVFLVLLLQAMDTTLGKKWQAFLLAAGMNILLIWY